MLLYKDPVGREAGAACERLLLRIISLVLFETQVGVFFNVFSCVYYVVSVLTKLWTKYVKM